MLNVFLSFRSAYKHFYFIFLVYISILASALGRRFAPASRIDPAPINLSWGYSLCGKNIHSIAKEFYNKVFISAQAVWRLAAAASGSLSRFHFGIQFGIEISEKDTQNEGEGDGDGGMCLPVSPLVGAHSDYDKREILLFLSIF